MATIEFVWDSRDLAVWRGAKVDKALARALSKAGGDAIRAMRSDGKRRVRDRKRIRASYLADKALPLSFPRKGAGLSGLAWRMDVSGKAVPLSAYPARQTRLGVSVQVNKGKRSLLKGAFIRTLKSGHVGIFTRQGKKRLPIDHALSTRVSDVFKDADLVPAVQGRAQAVLSASFERLLPLELAKLGR